MKFNRLTAIFLLTCSLLFISIAGLLSATYAQAATCSVKEWGKIREVPINSNTIQLERCECQGSGFSRQCKWRKSGTKRIGSPPTPIPTLTPTPLGPPTSIPTHTPTPAPPPVEWLPIPAGDFLMGSNADQISAAVAECNLSEGNCKAEWFADEQPQKTVYVAAFQIGKYEVTNSQYEACVVADECSKAGLKVSDTGIVYVQSFSDRENPVVGVTYFDAAAFCAWIGGRLPTEEEWEKAARGTDGRRYPWSNIYQIGKANLSSSGPTRVGSYPAGASPYEVHDMAGNAFEWTNTSNSGKYVLKGGSWNNYPFRGRSSDRGTRLTPDFANYDIGFRCAR